MKKTILAYTYIALLIIILLSIIFLTWKITLIFLHAFSQSQPAVQASVIAGIVTVLASVVSITQSAKYQKQREIDAEHRIQKSAIYEEFMAFIFDQLIASAIKNKNIPKDKIVTFFLKFHRRIMIWGSDAVLNEYTDFLNSMQNAGEADVQESIIKVFKLFRTMRHDLGFDNKKIKESDMLKLWMFGSADVLIEVA